ncbi:sugar transferase [Sphingomonas sp. ac-8]|uniref:sugar transferase n=1 Tax=Sphingomonas sp. ac-8 TaxID=3242977 RepID=UPI003A80A519
MKPFMYQDALRKRRISGRSLAFLLRFQVLLLIAIIVFLSMFLPIVFPSMRDSPTTLLYSAASCSIASSIGIYILRGIRNYPGVEESFYAVPAFCVAYGILLVMLILFRIPYSRLLLTSAFAASILVSFVIHTLLRRRILLRIGVVKEGEYARLIETPGVEWRLLDTPDAPLEGLNSVSVDLWSDLSDEWERKLASLALQGIPVYHSKHLRESLTGRVEIERISENNFGTLSPLYAYMTAKHAFDWIAALVALVALLPLLIVVGIVIRLDSSGPVIFRQTRIGYRGRPFKVYKLRTMTVARHVDQSAVRDAAMTKDNDQRITGIGRFLRHSRVDELPQLINVLRGEMSWIGPRPEAEILSRWYESEIPFYHYRHIVRPGITGWAQVHQGHVADVAQVREKLNFDFYYIKNFSLWIDFIVVMRTIRTMLTGFGSR